MDEAQWIAEFRKNRSEDAFASLVRRHVDFVYATALRQVGDCGLAEEITQDVFLVLARKAGSLGRYQTIAGWLYQTTLNRVRQRLRSELRRQRRESIAAELHANAGAGQSIWEPLVPLLDEGLGAIDERDRLALLLHCLEGRGFREVGEALGLGEDAARKRVHRALERLTDFFRRHGFAVPTITAGTALFVGVSAPASLVGSIVSSGLAAIPTAATLGVLMTPTMFKAGLATLLVAAVATPILLQQATIRRQDAELGRLRDASAELERLREENARLATAQVDTNELNRLRAGNRELMQLRAEVARLRTAPRSDEVGVEAGLLDTPEGPSESVTNAPPPVFRAQLQAPVPVGGTLVTGGWMTAPGRRSLVLMTPQLMGEGAADRQVLVESTFVEAPEDVLSEVGLGVLFAETETVTHGYVLAPAEAQEIARRLKETEGVDLISAPRVTLVDGRQARISDLGPNRGVRGRRIGVSVNLIPHISPDGQTVDLTVLAEMGERNIEPPAVDNLAPPPIE
ncbi:MAG: sigma-70 family RNA polymerase sigma factor [Verrucomicrobia bacterium]|nr:sigma-70 family RNA polymerase sigma factor [Verrucomicrobiota bacterium]